MSVRFKVNALYEALSVNMCLICGANLGSQLLGCTSTYHADTCGYVASKRVAEEEAALVAARKDMIVPCDYVTAIVSPEQEALYQKALRIAEEYTQEFIAAGCPVSEEGAALAATMGFPYVCELHGEEMTNGVCPECVAERTAGVILPDVIALIRSASIGRK